MRLKALILLLCILLVHCSIDPVVQDAETVGDYFAYCTLSPEFEKQIVLAGRTVPESLPYWPDDIVITLSGCGQTSHFQFTGNGMWEEIPPCVPIVGDSLYFLDVLFSGGQHITATTRVPGDFTILDPAPNDTVLYQLGPRSNPNFKSILPVVEWTPSHRAYYYYSYSEAREGYCAPCPVFTNFTRIIIPHYPYTCSLDNNQSSDYYINISLFVEALDSSRGAHSQPRFWLGLETPPDTDPVFDQLEENSVKQEYIDLHGGYGFFNAINWTKRDFVLHVKFVEPDSGEVE